ncbi:hypothetical protein H1R20_g10738, partial [Candolleomyces eurysporus]
MSLAFAVRRVTEVTDAELKSAEAVFASAFKGGKYEPMLNFLRFKFTMWSLLNQNLSPDADLFTDVVTGGDQALYGEFHGLTVTACLRGGQVYFAENENREIIGVAVWFAPEQAHPLDSVEGPMVDLAPFLPKLRPEVQEWWTDVYLPDCARLLGNQFVPEKRLTTWHLQDLATAPEYQRKGVARALIDTVKKQAAENGKTLSCLLPTNELRIDILKKLGFEVGEDTIAFHSVEGRKFDLSVGLMEPAVEPKGLD